MAEAGDPDCLASVEWCRNTFRKQVLSWVVSRLLLEGRAICFINRDGANRVKRLEPLDIARVVPQMLVDEKTGDIARKYVYTKRNGKQLVYDASDVLDFVLQLMPDNLGHYSPLVLHRNSIGLVIAAERYASNLFASGGVPPLALQGPSMSPQAAERANEQMDQALRNSRDRNRNVVAVPAPYELKDLGFDPQKQQMIELRKFQISEVSRIFNVAPAMLHDLTGGTYSNVEQQNLNFAQQTITPLVELMEQEMNLKLFPSRSNTNFVEFSLDGLVRGDFASRMTGYATSVQNAIRTPNEIRALENLPPMEGGDQLMIQGATVPVTKAGEDPAAPAADKPADNNTQAADEAPTEDQ
jgi:HK97 family phage portal protein